MSLDNTPAQPQRPSFHFFLRLKILVAPALELGESRGNTRRMIPITGGHFEGPSLRGEVLPGGADWQYTRPDGVAVLDARYLLRTTTGEVISIVNRGFRHGVPELASLFASGQPVSPSLYYFMTAPLMESASPDLQWLSRAIFIGEGKREHDCVILNVWIVGDRTFL